MNGACYIRVSTDEQTEFSPMAQKRAIFLYAKNHNINIAPNHIFIDEGFSGRNAKKRPAFQSMIKSAHTLPKPFDIILVHKLDRFSRSREDSIVYKSLLKRECDVKVISVSEPVEDDKFAIILEAFLEAMAEYYSVNLSEEVMKGMTEKAYLGGFQTRPPYGYLVKETKKPLIVQENEALVVKKIFQMRLENCTYNDIATILQQSHYKTKKNNNFTRKSVAYIAKNPIYCGYLVWHSNNNTIVRKSTYVPPIISLETFLLVNPWFKAYLVDPMGF